MRRLFLVSLFLMTTGIGWAQKVERVSATYTYYAPETMSVEEAKRTALERAKIQAIADEFGTIVSQSNSTVIANRNGETDSQFFSFGGSEVRGEWIETTDEPKYEISYKDNYLVVVVSVKGRAREIVSAGIDFVAKPLRNGTTLRFESAEFKDGDDFYLYFQSPIDGNVAAYLLDETTQTVYCVLPYKRQSDMTAFPVEANKEYTFFSRTSVERQERANVDEYVLSCDNEREFNTLYVLFSPSEIGKRTGFDNSIEDKPDNISYRDFRQWLSKTLSKDSKIQFQEIHISINK